MARRADMHLAELRLLAGQTCAVCARARWIRPSPRRPMRPMGKDGRPQWVQTLRRAAPM
jgi:hypothetical protein